MKIGIKVKHIIDFKVRRSTVPDRSTVKIDDNELALLIQDGNEDNRKAVDTEQEATFLPTQHRFMQTQTIFAGVSCHSIILAINQPKLSSIGALLKFNYFHNPG